MNRQAITIALIILGVIIALFIFHSCQRIREVELKQKTRDEKTELFLEVEREKEEVPAEAQ